MPAHTTDYFVDSVRPPFPPTRTTSSRHDRPLRARRFALAAPICLSANTAARAERRSRGNDTERRIGTGASSHNPAPTKAGRRIPSLPVMRQATGTPDFGIPYAECSLRRRIYWPPVGSFW